MASPEATTEDPEMYGAEREPAHDIILQFGDGLVFRARAYLTPNGDRAWWYTDEDVQDCRARFDWVEMGTVFAMSSAIAASFGGHALHNVEHLRTRYVTEMNASATQTSTAPA